MVERYKAQLRSRMPMVRPIFQVIDVLGRHQIRGRANGPILARAIIIVDFLKYQGVFSVGRGGDTAVKNSPQCLHLMALS
jgi:hypothetical protein